MKKSWICSIAVVLALLAAPPLLHASFNEDYKAARELYNKREYDKALEAFEQLYTVAESDSQKQTALYYSMHTALRLKAYDKAMQFAKDMPDKPASFNSQAGVLRAERKSQEILDLYKDQDLASWPANHAGTAYSYMAGANRVLGNADEALANLDKALEVDDRTRSKAGYFIQQGDIQHQYKKDDAKAIASYKKVYDITEDQTQHVNAAVRIATIYLTQDKAQQALDELDTPAAKQIEAAYYAGRVAIAKGEALAKLGRNDEAKAVYEQGLKIKGLYASHKKTLERELEALK